MSDWEQGHARNKGKAVRAFMQPQKPAEPKADRATDILMGKARAYREAHKEVSAQERKRTVPNPKLTPTGTLRRDGDAVGRAAQKQGARERHGKAERMKAILKQQSLERERTRER
jgi:hypothetical protein